MDSSPKKESLRKRTVKWLSYGLISQAIAELETAFARAECAEERRNIDAIRQLYSLMANYALNGNADNSRAIIVARIRNSIVDSLESYERRMRVDNNQSSALYPSSLRTLRVVKNPPLKDTLSELEHLLQNELNTSENASDTARRLNDAQKNFFNHLWLTHPLTGEDENIIKELIDSNINHVDLVLQLAVGGLFLGEMEYHDDRRMELLAEIYGKLHEADPVTALKALTALCLALRYHGEVRTAWRERLATTLASLSAVATFQDDLRSIVIETVKTRDTERVSKHIVSDIIPSLMKLNKDAFKFGNISEMDMDMLEDNPEWMTPLEDLSRLHEEGADVMMSTFAPLKSHPFFNELYRWFVPYKSAVWELTQNAGANRSHVQKIISFLDINRNVCDTDKFSLALALSQVPESQIGAMQERLTDELGAMEEMAGEENQREAIIRNNVRNLHRFYSFFNRKSEFTNALQQELLLSTLQVFDPIGLKIDFHALRNEAANFLFSKRYYDQALPLYRRNLALFATDELHEKVAYCLQQTGDFAGALEHYNRASDLAKATKWRLRRMVHCHKMLGNYAEAIRLYKEVLAMTAEPSVKQLLTLANLYLLADRRSEALPLFIKADYMDPQALSSQRAIIWISLLDANFERAKTYTERLFNNAAPEPADYLNRAYLALLTGQPRQGADDLRKAFAGMKVTAADFVNTVSEDLARLENSGLDILLANIALSEAINK